MRQREHQSGFGTVEILLVVLVVAVLAVTGLVVYQRHKPTSAKDRAAAHTTQTTTQPQSTTTTQTQQTVQYLTVKEWGVKLPLSSSIQDAYYVIPTGISNDEDGKPSGIYLDVASLKSSCGDISVGNTNTSIEKAVGEIVRTLPTDKDPVSGKLYTQLNPNGTTIGGYYYGYTSGISGKTCASPTLLKSVDSAFATATKGMAPATN